MNGCLSINRLMLRNHCNDWKQIQATIDKFIKAGLESFLIHDQSVEDAVTVGEILLQKLSEAFSSL